MSYGSWGILEPDPRDDGPIRGAQVLLADPAWLLSRQWVYGELDGFDGGAPCGATVRYTHTPFARMWTDDGALERPGGPNGPAVLSEMAELGLNAPDAASRINAALADDPRLSTAWAEALADLAVEEAASPRLRFIARRGARRGAFDLLSIVAAEGDRIAGTAARLAEIVAAAERVAAGQPEPDAFSSRTLDHRATWATDGLGEGHLTTRESRPVWWGLDDVRAPNVIGWEEARPVPSRMTFPGAPPSRFWSIAERTTDWQAVEAGPSELPTMIAAFAMAQVGPDTLILPVTAPRGGVLHVGLVEVRDAFGNSTVHRHAVARPNLSGPDLWGTREDANRPGTLIDFAERNPLVGESIETVAIVPEDAAGVVWWIERRVPNGIGSGRDVIESVKPDDPPGENEPPAFDLRRPPPENWLPLLREAGTDVLVPRPLRAGDVPTRLLGRLGSALKGIESYAVPADGIGLERSWRLGRDPGGRAIAWVARQQCPHREHVASGLAFDRLILPGDRQ